jgi:hypothetical protein
MMTICFGLQNTIFLFTNTPSGKRTRATGIETDPSLLISTNIFLAGISTTFPRTISVLDVGDIGETSLELGKRRGAEIGTGTN